MRIRIVAVGTRMPEWLDSGYKTYEKRLPRECRLELREIPLGQRSRSTDTTRAMAAEGEKMLSAVAPSDHVIALDVGGRMLDTPALAKAMDGWTHDGRDVALLIGGPDGLAPHCLERAESRWSLSPLTLPHGLVRVIVAEQIYRAWSLLRGHPYHRA